MDTRIKLAVMRQKNAQRRIKMAEKRIAAKGNIASDAKSALKDFNKWLAASSLKQSMTRLLFENRDFENIDNVMGDGTYETLREEFTRQNWRYVTDTIQKFVNLAS